MTRRVAVLFVLVASLGLVGCGSGDESSSGGGDVRTVLVDYRHDEFASAFLRYYPESVKVRQGDTVRFNQTWTGEAHTVTAGLLVNDLLEFAPIIMKYESPEAALAGGESQETLDRVLTAISKVPGFIGREGDGTTLAGAEPCYVAEADDVPQFTDPATDEPIPGAECPTKGGAQPEFNGRQALYNSGFIPYEGEGGNTFEIPVAADADPGTYQYFCNLHFISMSGSFEVVAADADIPGQSAVSRQAREEIEEDEKVALDRVRDANKGEVGDLELPLAGREADAEFAVAINEFFPRDPTVEVGEKVTWTVDGIGHTVSFNVPTYFPIYTVEDDGTVVWNPQSYKPVGFDIPESADEPEPAEGPPVAKKIDVGEWDGRGGFHSSGIVNPGDKFSITFTRAGTYPYACVLHPKMVGTLKVEA